MHRRTDILYKSKWFPRKYCKTTKRKDSKMAQEDLIKEYNDTLRVLIDTLDRSIEIQESIEKNLSEIKYYMEPVEITMQAPENIEYHEYKPEPLEEK